MSTTHAGTLSILVDIQMVPFALIGAVFWMRRRRDRAARAVEAPAAVGGVPLLAAEPVPA